MRWLVIFAILWTGVPHMLAQNPATTQTATTACTFQDGKQMSVRYERGSSEEKKELPSGELWPPSGSPMYMFTQADLTVGNAEIPVGAYSLYVIPEKTKWTLIVNRVVSEGATYDQQQDVVRVPMQIGHLSQPQRFQIAFGHVAPKQCNMRIYHDKTGVWMEFKEK